MSVNYLSSVLCLVLNFYLIHGEACQTYPAQVKGSCIAIQDCPRLTDLIRQVRNQPNSHAVDTLRRSICSLRPTTVCCESPAPNSERFPPRTLDCGRASLVDFVVGGRDASWWPWMVLLIGENEQGGQLIPICGGTLISDRFVITAAHCNDPQIILKFARIGELIRSTNPDTYKGRTAPPVQDIQIAQFISHPHYQQGCIRCNDIALLWLAEPVKRIVGFVEPICLPLQPKQQLGFKVSEFQGKIGSVAGWGRTNSDPSISSQADHLQKLNIAIGTSKFCEEVTSKHLAGSTLCAGDGNGKDTCNGDTGGPLVMTNEIGTRNFLIGVSSFGPTFCGGKGTQGIYMNVHHYLPWILNNIHNSTTTTNSTGHEITFGDML